MVLSPLANTFFCLLLMFSSLVDYTIDIIKKNPINYNHPEKSKYPFNFIYWIDEKITDFDYFIRYRFLKKRNEMKDKWWFINSKSKNSCS